MDIVFPFLPLRQRPSMIGSFPLQRFFSVGIVIALHFGLFYYLQHGLLQTPILHPAAPQPKEVIVSLITSDTLPNKLLPETTPHRHLTPKIIPTVKKVIPPRPISHPHKTTSLPRSSLPVVHTSPSENAVTTPHTVNATPATPAPSTTPSIPDPIPTTSTTETNTPTESSTKTPPPSKTHQPKTVSGIEYLREPEQNYPPLSRRLGEEGRVVIRVLVNESGHTEKAIVYKSSGFDRLDEAARQAVLGALFKPYIEEGVAIPAYTLIPIAFHLD